jgi:TIR domain
VIWFFPKNIYITFGVLNRFSFCKRFTHSIPHYRKRVQNAIQDSSALLIVLSKASVESEWCKKELNAGLMRELDEKRVIVLPILVEDCNIPPFLREKKYADFRTDFQGGLNELLGAVAGITSADQGRLRSDKTNTDWSETWGFDEDNLFFMEYTLVEFSPDLPTFLTRIFSTCNDIITRRYREYEEVGLGWVGRISITEHLAMLAAARDLKILLTDQFPKIERYFLVDRNEKKEHRVIIDCRRLGPDNGKNQLLNVGNYLRLICEHVRTIARKLTPKEEQLIKQILARDKQPATNEVG